MALVQDFRFHWADYVILCLTLLLSCSVGVYYGIVGRKKSTAEDYLMAGRSMPVVPVSFSLFVSFLSSVAFLSDPVEVYYYGSIYWVIGVGGALGIPITAHVFAPKLYRMRLTSVYEYLEIRYNAYVRIVSSLIAGFGAMLFMGVVLYVPSLALSQVSGLEVWLCIVIIGAACTFYTSLGGMKAVLWADTIQFFIMVSGLLAIAIQGTIKLGGTANIWRICEEGGRINFNRFNPNPFLRSTFWTFLIGGIFRVLNPYISGQIWVQRYCTLQSERDVKKALYLNIPLFLLFGTLFTANGLVLFAYYEGCDPLKQGRVNRPDQMIPLLVLELFQSLPGVPGLFVGSVVSASLSTLSSGQSGLAAMCLSDAIHPLYKRFFNQGQPMSERTSSVIAKVICVVLGIITIVLGLFPMLIKGSTVFQLAMSFINATFGPAAGVFIVGILFPFISTSVAIIGSLVSLVVSVWLTMGTLATGIFHDRLPISIDQCLVRNMTSLVSSNSFPASSIVSSDNQSSSTAASIAAVIIQGHSSGFSEVYKFSPALYPALGPIINIICSLGIWASLDIYRRIRERLNGKHPKKHLVRIGETKRRTRDEFTQCHNEDWRNWEYTGYLCVEPIGVVRTTTL